MALVTSEKMLADAQKGNYAVGAFNVENMEMVKAVLAAAEELHAPVMLQTTPSTVKWNNGNFCGYRCGGSKESICSGMFASGSWK